MKAKAALAGICLLTACGFKPNATAIDGDTFRSNGKTYRLAGIDTPEFAGHCRPGRVCAEGDPYAAKRALQWHLDRLVRCEELGPDYYGRTLVNCWTVDNRAVGQQMIALGYAEPYRRSN